MVPDLEMRKWSLPNRGSRVLWEGGPVSWGQSCAQATWRRSSLASSVKGTKLCLPIGVGLDKQGTFNWGMKDIGQHDKSQTMLTGKKEFLSQPCHSANTSSPGWIQWPYSSGDLALPILFLGHPQNACPILWLRWLMELPLLCGSFQWAGVERRQSCFFPSRTWRWPLLTVYWPQSTASCKDDWERWFSPVWPCTQIRHLFIKAGENGYWGDNWQFLCQHWRVCPQSLNNPS